jgi:hypothetical protein
LLATERKQEFDELLEALEQDLKPRGAVEEMYVAHLANCIWEISRLRRAKAAIINLAFKDALSGVLYRLMGSATRGTPKREELSNGWFHDAETKNIVLTLLKLHSLDETVIEAEAIRRTASELEKLDQMIAVQEARLKKVLRAITDFRESFADRARTAASNLIEAAPVTRLEKRPVKKIAAQYGN